MPRLVVEGNRQNHEICRFQYGIQPVAVFCAVDRVHACRCVKGFAPVSDDVHSESRCAQRQFLSGMAHSDDAGGLAIKSAQSIHSGETPAARTLGVQKSGEVVAEREHEQQCVFGKCR